MAESLEFGGGGEPFPPEGERVSPKIKMKTFPLCHTVHTRVVQENGKFRCNPRVQGSHPKWKAWFAELYLCAK